MDSRPIGVFDSGLGGLTVVKSIKALLPSESIIYFGDTARVPYGNKSRELIKEYSSEITEFLVKKDSKMVVVACNTVSAMVLSTLKKNNSIPILGVIEPGVAEAISITNNKYIGVIGTIATVNSDAYNTALKALDSNIETISQACPLFVPLAEEGWLEGDVVNMVVAHYLSPLKEKNIDTLILGCTHYPLLKNAIANQFNKTTVLIDSADAVARAVQKQLSDFDLLNNKDEKGSLFCFVTDIPMHFETVGQQFLGSPLDSVQIVHDF
ncbi:MAG TPA: glutamate racemase [Candidatus Marinimicrobia bacterium]|nr:glutamate racemase [Candidatus Neomarinimicrobiota bacterium]